MRRSFGIALGVLGAVGGSAGTAAAATAPAPVELARLAFVQSSGADALVDRAGNLHVVFRDSRRSDNGAIFRYVRRAAAGGKAVESPVPIVEPGGFTEVPLIYVLPTGDLRVLATGSGGLRLFAAGSADAGRTWTALDTAAFPGSPGLIPNLTSATDAHGGVLTAGYGGGANALLRLRDDLTGFDVVTTPYAFADGTQPAAVAVAVDGTVYGTRSSSGGGDVPVLAGAAAATVPHPACATEGFVDADVAGGASAGVLLTSGCTGTWVRPVSAAGAVGGPVRLGTAPVAGGLADVARTPAGGFVAVWQDESGDLGVARSANGTAWRVAKGLLPVAERQEQVDGRLARGNPTWFAWTDAYATAGNDRRGVARAIKLTSIYARPAVATRGVTAARVARLGSLAAALPRSVGRGALARTGVVTLRLATAVPDTVAVNITLTRELPGNGGTLSVATFNANVRVVPGTPKTMGASLASGGFSVGIGGGSIGGGGGGPKLPEARRGDTITYTLGTRNGELQATGVVG
jgi:hypothetical protein